MKIEVSMDIEVATLAHFVEAGPGEIRIRDQALDTSQALNETDERNRVERIKQRPQGRRQRFWLELELKILLAPLVTRRRSRCRRKFTKAKLEDVFVEKIGQHDMWERCRGIVS